MYIDELSSKRWPGTELITVNCLVNDEITPRKMVPRKDSNNDHFFEIRNNLQQNEVLLIFLIFVLHRVKKSIFLDLICLSWTLVNLSVSPVY